MLLLVQYRNGKFEYIPRSELEELIDIGALFKFFRPASKAWAVLGVDSVRQKAAGSSYSGPERRVRTMSETIIDQLSRAISRPSMR
jgi:hypothetical protein